MSFDNGLGLSAAKRAEDKRPVTISSGINAGIDSILKLIDNSRASDGHGRARFTSEDKWPVEISLEEG